MCSVEADIVWCLIVEQDDIEVLAGCRGRTWVECFIGSEKTFARVFMYSDVGGRERAGVARQALVQRNWQERDSVRGKEGA
jgi:hypothetical protein